MTPQTTIQGDFPYEEIRRPDEDYFQSWQEAKDAGYDDDQIWSVTTAEGDDGSEWIITGPPHHYVNHIGHIATLERHDNNTYYEECWRTAEEAAEEEEDDEETLVQRAWLIDFKAEFLRRTGITWEEGGNTDQDAIDRWCFHGDVTDPNIAVSFHIEKYELTDITL